MIIALELDLISSKILDITLPSILRDLPGIVGFLYILRALCELCGEFNLQSSY